MQPIQVTLAGGDPAVVATPLLFVAIPSGEALPAGLQSLNTALGGSVQAALESRDFRGARDEILYLTGSSSGPRRVALIGTGTAPLTPSAVRRAAAIAARHAQRLGTGEVTFWVAEPTVAHVEAAVTGLHIGVWQYLDTKTLPPDNERKAPVTAAAVVAEVSDANTKAVATGNAIGAGQSLARTLAMMPGNLCTPDFLADTAKDLATRHGLTFTSLDRAGLERERMGSFLSVAQGTPQEPRLVTLEYAGGKPGAPPVVLVGKGLCFDSGGISIKPAQGMEWMKFDMCGAAGVIGAMEVVAQLKLPLNVVGVFGATTNMPSGTACRPGDVVQSQFGKYIEIINTDAEGRLVLADLLSYVRRFKPAAVIDAATLTGAAVITLGHTATAVFGNDQSLVNEVLAAGERAGERGWQMPMWDDYKELIKSDVADVKNSGGRPAASITAALFLQEFVEGYPWVHLDIAGTAYTESDLVWLPRGPSGNPVGTFVELLRTRAAE
ncbi:MAG TPA: leucyl aminopeptidase [Gemmatimonadaceae bacterium]|jgi:leucyl aminopeptidase|nr:leucyl aminopeptidase [Gemmatimonadaceae bacterium]